MALKLLGVVGGSGGMSMISTGAAEAIAEKSFTVTDAGGSNHVVEFDGTTDLSNPGLPELATLLTETGGDLVVAHSGLYVVFVNITAYTETDETSVVCQLTRGAGFEDAVTTAEVLTNASDGTGDNHLHALRDTFQPPAKMPQGEVARRMATTVALNAGDALRVTLDVSTTPPWSIDVGVSVTLTALMLQL